MSDKKVLLVEFNELSPTLLQKWMSEGKLPNFKALYSQSNTFVTHPDVSNDEFLEPWIQWYSIHTGLPYDQHKVFHLTDGPRRDFLDIWNAVADSGRPVGSFASMNAKPFERANSFFIGDPWSEHGKASPAHLSRFLNFVASMVREYTNPKASNRLAEASDFMIYMIQNGLSLDTVKAIFKQLLSERTQSRPVSYRRGEIMDMLQWDLFATLFQKYQPALSSFFCNSTAHLQHSYWKHMEPHKFNAPPTEQELVNYKDAILTGYQAMDRMLKKMMDLADSSGTTLIFLTGLSQHACPQMIQDGDKSYFRLYDVEAFFRLIDLQAKTIEPTMAHQFMLTFDSSEQKATAVSKLKGLKRADGENLMLVDDRQEKAIYFNCFVGDPAGIESFTTLEGRTLPFKEHFYKLPTTKNGRHHPDGCLWIRTGSHREHTDTTSILNVFPTVLGLLDIPRPAAYSGPGIDISTLLSGPTAGVNKRENSIA